MESKQYLTKARYFNSIEHFSLRRQTYTLHRRATSRNCRSDVSSHDPRRREKGEALPSAWFGSGGGPITV